MFKWLLKLKESYRLHKKRKELIRKCKYYNRMGRKKKLNTCLYELLKTYNTNSNDRGWYG